VRFLADENIPFASITMLRKQDHDVLAVREAMPGAPDWTVLAQAAEDGRVLITFDRDFGRLLYQQNFVPPSGLVLLRFEPTNPTEPAMILISLLDRPEIELEGKFSVVDREKVRQRPLRHPSEGR
jgi:predicted nuclease of predicted toxin-antitoxin system